MTERKWVGREVKRKEDPRLITGQATYVGDISFPGMYHVAFVRSLYAHARIKSIDTSAAARRPGVVAVVTGEDLRPHYEPVPMSTSTEGGSVTVSASNKNHTHYALSIGVVRHVGEAVAAVLATSPGIAADAAAEVVVNYDPLPAAITPEQALAPGAPKVFDDAPDNVEHVWRCRAGDVEAAFAAASRVVSQHVVNQRIAGIPMECRGVLAMAEPATGGLTVWVSHQGPHFFRADLAKTLRLPENSIRAIAPEVGGGFGVKGTIFPEDIAVAALARIHKRPVRWLETRSEHMLATYHGRAQAGNVEAAVQPDGQVTALRLRIVGDVGAYPIAPIIPDITGEMAVGVYGIPAVDIEVTCVHTHTTPVSAYRGAGRPEAAFYVERLMDLIAFELNLDPAEVRRRNFIPPDAFPYKTPTGKLYDSGEYDKPLVKALALADYAGLRQEQARRLADPASDRLLGIGLSTYTEICGFGPYESAVVRVDPTGTVTVFTGISPHGQGQETSFAQIVADELGADYDKVVVRHGDTATTPMGWGTGGSRGLVVGGMALVRGAAIVRDKARRIAAHIFEAAPEDVELADGRYQVKGVPDRSLTLAEIADKAYSDELPMDIDGGLEATDFYRPPNEVYPFGAQVAVVEIERETGIVHVRDFISVDDCGHRISPLLVDGQVHGGVVQGIAQALWEETVYDGHGQLLSGSLMDYTVPHADMLPRLRTAETVTPTPHNSLGVKGIGELPTIGSTPAMVNAVLDALKPFGVKHLDMPLRPEKIWRAMQP